MLKRFKFINIICIVLVFSVLALALAVGLLAVNALRSSEMYDDPLADYEEYEKKQTTPPSDDTEDNLLPYRVRSDISVGTVYLRDKGYGNYNGQTWLAATPYTELIDGKYPATYLGVKQIEKWNLANPLALEIVPNNCTKVVPHYTATQILGNPYTEEYDIPIDDVTANPKGSEYYRMYYYDYKDISLKPSVPMLEYEQYEAEYRQFVYNQYLTIDERTKSFMLNIAKEQALDENDEELAAKISEYVKSIGTYSLSYNTELDQQENVAIAFVETYKDGTCKHFASVATLLFRALGIPARYVTGYMTETVAGEWVQLTNFDSHAWVEVYVDGFGWKNVEVTPQRLDSNVTVKPTDVSKVYDGTPLYPDQKIVGLEAYLEKGYTYEAAVSGERTEPGTSESKIDSLKVFDPQGNDVTEKFNFTFEIGKIHIYAGYISLESEDFTYAYDGTSPLSQIELCKVVFPEGEELPQGYNIEILAKELPSSIGEHPHAFSVRITNADGEDITNTYKMVYNFGSVEITAIELVLKAKSAEKAYDGTELVCNEIEIVEGSLSDGDVISSYTVVGSQTEPGQSANVVELSSIVITNKDGEDVTSSYHLTVEDGSLMVYLPD